MNTARLWQPEVIRGKEAGKDRYQKILPKPNQYMPVEYDFEQVVIEMLSSIKDNIEQKQEEETKIGHVGYTSEEMLIVIEEKEQLKRELNHMKFKLEYCIPVHSIVYMTCSSLVFGSAITLLFLQIFRIVNLWDIRYTFGITIGSLGLFITAFLSLRDWKEFLDETK